MSIPIWVCDPTGNNNPYLKIVTSGIFSLLSNQNNVAQFYWSTDGINWTTASTPAGNTGNSVAYYNGIFAMAIRAAVSFDGLGMTSFDGKNWTTSADSPTGPVQVIVDSANNRIKWTDFGNTNVFVNARVSAGARQGDQFGITFPQPDPSQPVSGSPGYLPIALPGGLTAIRFNVATVCEGKFDYTKTPITNTIVNSGTGWPAASWTTTLDLGGFGRHFLLYGESSATSVPVA